MAKINVLSFAVANLIAAGEVVDRPASVIKELMENAIDAGAKHITVEIQHGGVTFMRVADDGCGIDPEDLPVAIRRHATSKIKEADDLDGILTLGFRGEALAAIAAVSDLRIITRTKDAEYGSMLVSSAGEVEEIVEQGAPVGTTVIVENLFANVPARRKFLKKDVAETTAVSTYVEKIALSHPEIAIRLIVDGNQRLDTVGDGTLESTMYAVFGREFVQKMIPVKSIDSDAIAVDGYICRPDNARPKRNYQNFFINGRYINSRTASAALEQAYTSFIAPEKFPCCVLNIKISPEAVDVNVHPAKLEVKFSNEKPVFEAVYYTVRAALEANASRPDMKLGKQVAIPHPVHAFAPVETPKAEQTTIDTVVTPTPRKDSFERMSAAEYRESVQGFTAHSPTAYTRVEPPRAAPIPMPFLERASAEVKAPKGSPVTDTARTAPTLPVREAPVQASAATPVRIAEPTPTEEVVTVEPWRVIGEAFHCYVIVEQGDKLLLIDKHAAHERVLFEDLKRKLKGHKDSAQMMMIPIELSLSAADVSTLEEYRTELERIGFHYSAHGNTALISEIPTELSAAAAGVFLQSLAADLGSGTANAALARDLLFEKSLYQAACKAAIKGGKEYPPEYVEALVKKLLEIPDITVCPHGRPVAMTLSHSNIDRQFKRS